MGTLHFREFPRTVQTVRQGLVSFKGIYCVILKMLLCLLFSPLIVPIIVERTSKWILPMFQWHLEDSPVKWSQNTSSNTKIRPIYPSVSQCRPKIFPLDPLNVPISPRRLPEASFSKFQYAPEQLPVMLFGVPWQVLILNFCTKKAFSLASLASHSSGLVKNKIVPKQAGEI
jgi:hypothetical protein